MPVVGSYEWHLGRRHRITRRDGDPLVLAGLWEGGTFTILTRPARAQMAALHDCEPAMIGRRQWQGWLGNSVFDPTLPPDDAFDIVDDDAAPVQDTLS